VRKECHQHTVVSPHKQDKLSCVQHLTGIGKYDDVHTCRMQSASSFGSFSVLASKTDLGSPEHKIDSRT